MVIPLDQRPRSGPYSGLNARSAKRFLTQAFEEAGLDFAEDDAREIVESATGLDRTAMMLRGTEFLTPEVFETIKQLMERRLAGEPVDHILGWREFYGRRFQISKAVLSPRADTETLIRGALARLNPHVPHALIDLGTGSGAIGLTLLAELEMTTLLATDLSPDALAVAKANAKTLNVENRVSFVQGPWWDAVPNAARFDMILSNPPYITNAAMKGLEPEVLGFDPDLALRGGPDGLDAYRAIIDGAKARLKPDGWLGFEIGFDQAASLSNLLRADGWSQISVDRDLGGNDRAVWAQGSPA
ncbi:release factor glutamine methyltransferase [Litorimonas cladophorae]|uniref:Release factor glutamine methyltransferase n=1 Tax=Litorimonas cladophorae TaxID=1220491 RepID=A0A918KMJ9_9PROT|nr:peptide chain release factor N(5)-glutamine methyltransferase [Litorimonas cladophorae]GGX66768.1 release factor glutamine methyltransferase [Litorimonas cladophorae]